MLGKPFQEAKVLFIPTAAMQNADKAAEITSRLRNELLQMGMQPGNITVHDIDGSLPEDDVMAFDAIYFTGGNTRYLAKRVRETGFDAIVKKFVFSNKVYVGMSAGSMLAMDNFNVDGLPESSPLEFKGLGLIKAFFTVHCEPGTPNRSDFPLPHISMQCNQGLEVTSGGFRLIEGVESTGFPREFADFLFRLQLNNTVAAMEENKVDYKRLITEPLMQLYNALTPAAAAVSETIITRPSKCVSTMYSDMRFSRDKPMKEYMYIRFREAGRESDILGLYFDMGRERYSYGLRIYKQTAAGMGRIRDGILANRQTFARELSAVKDLGMTVNGGLFAKDRFPDIEDDVIKNLLNRKHFYISKDCPVGDSVFCDGLANEISLAFAGLKGLYRLIASSL